MFNKKKDDEKFDFLYSMVQLSVQDLNLNNNNTGTQSYIPIFHISIHTHTQILHFVAFLLKMNDASTLYVNCRLSAHTHTYLNYMILFIKSSKTYAQKKEEYISTR